MIDGASSTLAPLVEPIWRPGAAQRLGALVELNLMPGLGEPCRGSQASQAATYDDHGIGHQLCTDGQQVHGRSVGGIC